MADTQVSILITAIDEASEEFENVLSNSSSMAARLNKTANSLGQLGDMASDFTEPLAKGLTNSKNAAIGFESGMAEVRKTTGLSAEKTALLGSEIKKLSRTIPLSTQQLTEIGVAAGQSGIAMGDIPNYIKDISKASVALAVDTDEAGLAFGRLTNIYGMSTAEIPKLAAAINVLGDSSVASEKEILKVIMRTAALSKQANLTAKDSAALGASFVSLGMAPQVAATAINALLSRMTTAEIQSARFQKGLAMVGMSGKELQNLTAENGTEAIFTLGSALDKLDPQEKAKAIGLMFGAEHSDNVGVFIDRMDVFKSALGSVGNDQQNVTRYNEVFATQLDTTASKMQMLNNSFQELAIEIGTALLPAVKAFAAFLTPIINKMTEFAAKHPNIVKLGSALAGLAISIGPLLFGLATIAKAWSLFSAGIPIVSRLSNRFLGIGNPISRFLNWLAIGNQRLLGMGEAAEDVNAPQVGDMPATNKKLPVCIDPIICDGFAEKLKELASKLDLCIPICICPEDCGPDGKKKSTTGTDSDQSSQARGEALPAAEEKKEDAPIVEVPAIPAAAPRETTKPQQKGLTLPQIALLVAALGATVVAVQKLTDSNAGLGEKMLSVAAAVAAGLAVKNVFTSKATTAPPEAVTGTETAQAATDLQATTTTAATSAEQLAATQLAGADQVAATQLAGAQQAGATLVASVQEAGANFLISVQQAAASQLASAQQSALAILTGIQQGSATLLMNAQQVAATQLASAQQSALALFAGIQQGTATFLMNAQQVAATQLASAQQAAIALMSGVQGVGTALLAGAQGAGSVLQSAGQEAGSLLVAGAQQAGAALSGMMEQASAMMSQASATLEATAQQAQQQAQAQKSNPLKTAGMIGLGALGIGGVAFAASKMIGGGIGGALGGLLNTAKGAIGQVGGAVSSIGGVIEKGNQVARGAGSVTGGAIGTGIRGLQAGNSIAKGAGEVAGTGIGGAIKSFGAINGIAKDSGAAVGQAMASAIKGTQSLGQAANSAGSGIAGAFSKAGQTIANSAAQVGTVANSAAANTATAWGKVQKAAGVTGQAWNNAGAAISGSAPEVVKNAGTIFDKIGGMGSSAGNSIGGAFNGAKNAIGGLASSASGFMNSPASKYILPVAGSVATAGIAGAVASRQQKTAPAAIPTPAPAALPQNQIAPFTRRAATMQPSAALPAEAPTPAADIATSAKNNIVPLSRSSNASGRAIGSELARGIDASKPQAELAAAGLAQSVSSYLPRSPAEKGPLSDINKTGFGLTQEFIKGIDGSAIQRKFNEVLNPQSKLADLSLNAASGGGASSSNSAVYSPTYNLQGGAPENFIAELEKHDRGFIDWLNRTQEKFTRGKY